MYETASKVHLRSAIDPPLTPASPTHHRACDCPATRTAHAALETRKPSFAATPAPVAPRPSRPPRALAHHHRAPDPRRGPAHASRHRWRRAERRGALRRGPRGGRRPGRHPVCQGCLTARARYGNGAGLLPEAGHQAIPRQEPARDARGQVLEAVPGSAVYPAGEARLVLPYVQLGLGGNGL